MCSIKKDPTQSIKILQTNYIAKFQVMKTAWVFFFANDPTADLEGWTLSKRGLWLTLSWIWAYRGGG